VPDGQKALKLATGGETLGSESLLAVPMAAAAKVDFLESDPALSSRILTFLQKAMDGCT
jgi:hypothetical protein